ncbi:MAG: hypothetical protein IKZ34_01745 [Alphaproteobacteria bacterium]|nr:hypothetical protein [Alphaproteobacteria bacterium]
MQSDNVNIYNKTPEQIFNELTANMDLKTKHSGFKEMHQIMFSANNSPWNIVRFLYFIFSVYYPSQEQFVNIHSHYDILSVGKELYSVTPTDTKYKKIPKYLHGVVNKRENTFMHSYDKYYIVKPARGQSKQYMEQCMKTFDVMLHFQKMQSLYNVSDNDKRLVLFVSELYNEVLKLVSMTTVCLAPKRKNIMDSGSMHLLNEYNKATSFGTVSNAVAARQEILKSRKSKTDKTMRLLRDMSGKEFDSLSQRHDAELVSVTDFNEFQNMLRQHEQERMELLAKQRARIQAFKQTLTNVEKKDEQERKYERLKAQLKMARITRMY